MLSSSEDENLEQFKEVVDCDDIRQCFDGSSLKWEGTRSKKAEKPSVNHFQEYIAKVLEQRLDREIEFVDVPPAPKIETPPSRGIKLLSSSLVYLTDDLEYDEPTKRPRSSYDHKEEKRKAKEAAVTPEWVLSKKETQFWVDRYKSRLTHAKLVKKHPDGSMKCEIIEK